MPPALGMLSGAAVALGATARYAGQSVAERIGGFPAGLFIAYLFIGSLVAAVLNAASNALNQISDIENDRVNCPHRPLPSGRLSLRNARTFAAITFAVAFFLAWFIAPDGHRHLFWLVIGAAVGTAIYSAPPARTKRLGIFANVTISLPRGLLLRLAGWSLVASVWYAEAWFLGFVFMVFTIGAATTKDFSDVAGDRAAGCLTLPVRYGARSAARIISPFLSLPWLLLPIGSFIPLPSGKMLLSASAPALLVMGVILFAYGIVVSKILLKEAADPGAAARRRSWTHMYLLMMLAQVGLAVVYLI